MASNNGGKPSHPSQSHGLFEIIEEETPDIPAGSRYGNFSYTAAISVKGLANDNPRDIAVKFTANTSQENALVAGKTYSASVRMVKDPGADEFTAYFNPGQPYGFITGDHFPVELANQVTMTGFGIVRSREEQALGDAGVPTLTCTLSHTDWSNEAGGQVDFDVTYVVVKKGLLAKSFGLFQIGRELLLSGVISDWDDSKKTWIVLVTSVAVASGHQSASQVLGPMTRGNLTSATRSKPLVKGSRSIEKPAIKPAMLSSPLKTAVNSGQDLPIQAGPSSQATAATTEEGEVPESPTPFVNTFAKKRSQGDVLADARKRMKAKGSA